MRNQPLRCTAGALAVLLGCQASPVAPARQSPELPLAEQAAVVGASTRRVAVVYHHEDPAVLEVPETGRVGEPITVQVTTYGGGCVRDDTTVATVAGLQADIVPYQQIFTPGPRGGCTRDLRITRRSVRVVFGTPGPARVRLIGRAQPGDSLIRLERQVTIR